MVFWNRLSDQICFASWPCLLRCWARCSSCSCWCGRGWGALGQNLEEPGGPEEHTVTSKQELAAAKRWAIGWCLCCVCIAVQCLQLAGGCIKHINDIASRDLPDSKHDCPVPKADFGWRSRRTCCCSSMPISFHPCWTSSRTALILSYIELKKSPHVTV